MKKSLQIHSNFEKKINQSGLDNDMDDKEKKALLNLANKIEKIGTNMPPEEIQTIVYTIGKENGYEKNLREWFKLLYQVLFGDIDGPRMGFFISFFGVQETVKLIKEKIN